MTAVFAAAQAVTKLYGSLTQQVEAALAFAARLQAVSRENHAHGRIFGAQQPIVLKDWRTKDVSR